VDSAGRADQSSRLLLYQIAEGRLLATRQDTGHMQCLDVAPDGQTIAVGRADQTVQFYRGSDLDLMKTIRVHDEAVAAVAFHPSDRVILTGSWDMKVRAWNLDTDAMLDEIVGLREHPEQITFSANGSHAAILCDSSARVWPFSARGIKPIRPRITRTILEFPAHFEDEQTRVISTSFDLAKEPGAQYELQVGIGHGYDNSGDQGITFKLVSEHGKSLLDGFANKKEWMWYQTTNLASGKLTLTLEDLDTDFNSSYPGNKADIKVNLIRY
jgi:WD40 repeat protein